MPSGMQSEDEYNGFDDAGMPILSSPVDFYDEAEDNAEPYYDENGLLQNFVNNDLGDDGYETGKSGEKPIYGENGFDNTDIIGLLNQEGLEPKEVETDDVESNDIEPYAFTAAKSDTANAYGSEPDYSAYNSVSEDTSNTEMTMLLPRESLNDIEPVAYVTYAPTQAKSDTVNAYGLEPDYLSAYNSVSEYTLNATTPDFDELLNHEGFEPEEVETDDVESNDIEPVTYVTYAPTQAKSDTGNAYGLEPDYFSAFNSVSDDMSNAEMIQSPSKSSPTFSLSASPSEDTSNVESGTIYDVSLPVVGDEISESNTSEDTSYMETATPTPSDPFSLPLMGDDMETITPTPVDTSSLSVPEDEFSESNTMDNTLHPTLTFSLPEGGDEFYESNITEDTLYTETAAPTPSDNFYQLPGDVLSESSTTEDMSYIKTVTPTRTPGDTSSSSVPEDEFSELNDTDDPNDMETAPITFDPNDLFTTESAAPTPSDISSDTFLEYTSSLTELPSVTPSFSPSVEPTSLPSAARTSLPSLTPISASNFPTNVLTDNTIIGITSASPTAKIVTSLSSPPGSLPVPVPPIMAHNLDDATWFNDESDQPNKGATVEPVVTEEAVDFYDMTLFEKAIYEVDLHQSALIAALVVGLSLFLMAFTASQVRNNPNGFWAGCCRLSILTVGFCCKLVLLPCYLVCCRFGQPDNMDYIYTEEYLSEDYKNDLELELT